jgi:hypothetical protein
MDAYFVTMHILKCPPEAMFRAPIRSLLRTFLKELIVSDVMVREANTFEQPRQALSFRTSGAELSILHG